MHLSDKFGELDSNKNVTGYKIVKIDGKFVITVQIQQKDSVLSHVVRTRKHTNLFKAVEEAIELFKEHLSDCSIC